MTLLIIAGVLIVIVVCAALIIALNGIARCPECGAKMTERFENIPEEEKEEKDEGYCYRIKTCSNGHYIKEKVLDPSRFLIEPGSDFLQGI